MAKIGVWGGGSPYMMYRFIPSLCPGIQLHAVLERQWIEITFEFWQKLNFKVFSNGSYDFGGSGVIVYKNLVPWHAWAHSASAQYLLVSCGAESPDCLFDGWSRLWGLVYLSDVSFSVSSAQLPSVQSRVEKNMINSTTVSQKGPLYQAKSSSGAA